jgi:hypothetical protein
MQRRVNIQFKIFLFSTLVEGEWSASRLCRPTPGERDPVIHWIGGWLDYRAGQNNIEKSKILEPGGTRTRPLGRYTRLLHIYWVGNFAFGKLYMLKEVSDMVILIPMLC